MADLELTVDLKRVYNMLVYVHQGWHAVITVIDGEPMKGITYPQVEEQLNSIIEWHFAHGQTLRQVTLLIEEDSDPLICAWVSRWLECSSIPKMICIQVHDRRNSTRYQLRTPDDHVLWEDNNFFIRTTPKSLETLLVVVRSDGRINARNMAYKRVRPKLVAMLRKAAALAQEYKSPPIRTIVVQIPWRLSDRHHGALEASILQCEWPTSTEQIQCARAAADPA